MRQTVDAPNGLRWTVKRLIVPTGMRPLTRTDMLDVATPRRTVVDGVSRQVPDAYGAWTGPLPLGFLLVPLLLPLVPLVLLLRRMRLLPWTIEARAHPWGRRYPPIVLTSVTPGTVRICGLMTQSWISRRSVTLYAVPSGFRASGSASTAVSRR